jgi:hypothetical protein
MNLFVTNGQNKLMQGAMVLIGAFDREGDRRFIYHSLTNLIGADEWGIIICYELYSFLLSYPTAGLPRHLKMVSEAMPWAFGSGRIFEARSSSFRGGLFFLPRDVFAEPGFSPRLSITT